MATLEWQVASGSPTAHVVDTSKPAWRNPDGSRRRNGPRSECGRYPQRNAEDPWFSLPVAEPGVYDAMQRYMVQLCSDCQTLTKETQP